MPGQRIYKVTLTEDERDQLRKMLASGKAAARKLNHARILLYADQDREGLRYTDQQIAATLGVSLATVARVRQRFVEESFTAALQPRPRPRGAYKLMPQAAASIIEVAKGEPPRGRKRWTIRLIAEHLIVAGYGTFSHETVRQVLKKTPSSRGKKRCGVCRLRPMRSSSPGWRTCWTYIRYPMIRSIPWCVWMSSVSS